LSLARSLLRLRSMITSTIVTIKRYLAAPNADQQMVIANEKAPDLRDLRSDGRDKERSRGTGRPGSQSAKIGRARIGATGKPPYLAHLRHSRHSQVPRSMHSMRRRARPLPLTSLPKTASATPQTFFSRCPILHSNLFQASQYLRGGINGNRNQNGCNFNRGGSPSIGIRAVRNRALYL